MKINVTAQHVGRYMEYAALCILSLIENGQVKESDIILSTEGEAINTFSFRAITKKYPDITVLTIPPNTIGQKYHTTQKVFERYPDVDSVLRLDSDTILTRKINFMQFLKHINTGEDVLYYRDPLKGPFQLKHRQSLMIPDFKDNSYDRMEHLIYGLFGGHWRDYLAWLEKQNWIYGGFHIVNRSFMKKPAWRVIKALGAVCISDEVAVSICRWANEKKYIQFASKELETPQFAIATCPNVLDFKYEGGMIHYSGDWYRLQKPNIKKQLDAAVDEALITLTK